MGMSASQVRYCMITGRKNDVEFQGQQINQQRTTLATQSSAYNTQLLDLKVPTPPSTSSYTTTTYNFTSNGTECTVLGAVYNTESDATSGAVAGTYTINYSTNATTSQGKSSGQSLFTSQLNGDGTTTYMTSTGTILSRVVTDSNASNYSAADISNIAMINRDCDNPTNTVYYKYQPSAGVTRYVTANDLQTYAYAGSTTPISTYYVDDAAEITTPLKMTGCTVNWTDSNRMSSFTDSEGTEYTLSITTENDENAYNDAYNEYEYQKSLYDQETEKINAQLDVIAAQDKKLELQLTNLDTQQQALSTEMDSIKKVIDKNVENSFKTFA